MLGGVPGKSTFSIRELTEPEQKVPERKRSETGKGFQQLQKKNVFVSFRILLSEITGRKEEGNLVKLCIIRSPAESKCA